MQSTTTAHHHHGHRHHHDIFIDPNPNQIPNSDRPKSNPRLFSLLLKSIIMLLITSLFFIFLSIATLIVLHFFLAGGHALRRRFTTAATSYIAADIERFLPMVKYEGVLDGKEDCAVCLELFKDGEWCRALPACGHVFHASCVDRWLIRRDNCPVCRARVRLDLGPTGLAMGDDDCKVFWAVGV